MSMSAEERRWINKARSLPCVLCGALGVDQQTPTTVHHIREGQGMAQRSSHWLIAALCADCHQGAMGFHGDRTLLRIAKVEELDLLAMTIERIEKAEKS